jgi:hypothetical protein
MPVTARYLLIAVAAVIVVAAGLYGYQASQHRGAKPADAGLLAQAEAACLSNTKAADKADVDAGVKAAKAEAHATASLGTTSSQDRGASRALAGTEQLSENDKIRDCMRNYLQHQSASAGAKAP